jgi:hypothetical protein
MKKCNPMPTLTYQGNVYKLRNRKTVVPDFSAMSNFETLIWINRNTTPRGYQKAANPLKGMGDIISMN